MWLRVGWKDIICFVVSSNDVVCWDCKIAMSVVMCCSSNCLMLALGEPPLPTERRCT